MAIPLIVGGAIMAAGAIGGAASRSSKNKKIARAIKNAPKYQVTEEAKDNLAMAKSRAYGRDRAVAMTQENVDRDSAAASVEAAEASGSTNDILAAISSINANRTTAKRDLAIAESEIQRQNMAALYAANMSMIDEKDKEFMQNKVAPWDANLRHLQAKKEEANSAWGSVFNIGSSILGGGLNSGGGGK
jgi:hypothetical protein